MFSLSNGNFSYFIGFKGTETEPAENIAMVDGYVLLKNAATDEYFCLRVTG